MLATAIALGNFLAFCSAEFSRAVRSSSRAAFERRRASEPRAIDAGKSEIAPGGGESLRATLPRGIRAQGLRQAEPCPGEGPTAAYAIDSSAFAPPATDPPPRDPPSAYSIRLPDPLSRFSIFHASERTRTSFGPRACDIYPRLGSLIAAAALQNAASNDRPINKCTGSALVSLCHEDCVFLCVGGGRVVREGSLIERGGNKRACKVRG
jgi:hypothetical protein